MKKIMLFAFFIVLFQGIAFSQESNAPDQTVKSFYSWYIDRQDTSEFPILDDKINDFVSKDTVKKLRKDYSDNKIDDVDYFTKVQDYDSKDWQKNTLIGKPIISNGTAKVSVVFGSSDKINIIVCLKKYNEIWKIVKVESSKN